MKQLANSCLTFLARLGIKIINVDIIYLHWLLDIFSHAIGPEKDTAGNLKSVSMETREILEELNRDYKTADVKEEEKKVADKFNAVSESEMY
jgi:hypothetical protein